MSDPRTQPSALLADGHGFRYRFEAIDAAGYATVVGLAIDGYGPDGSMVVPPGVFESFRLAPENPVGDNDSGFDARRWVHERRRCLQHTTAGPWFATIDVVRSGTSGSSTPVAECTGKMSPVYQRDQDAVFIADARDALPRALAAVEAALDFAGEMQRRHAGAGRDAAILYRRVSDALSRPECPS